MPHAVQLCTGQRGLQAKGNLANQIKELSAEWLLASYLALCLSKPRHERIAGTTPEFIRFLLKTQKVLNAEVGLGMDHTRVE